MRRFEGEKVVGYLDEPELAYLAGILDGEGCIMINKRKALPPSKRRGQYPYYYLAVYLTMANDYMPRLFGFYFGGSVCKCNKNSDGQHIALGWFATNRIARNALELLFPYLRLKKVEAKLGIEFAIKQSQRGRRGLTDKIIEENERAKQLMHSLKGNKILHSGTTKVGYEKLNC